MIKLKKRKNKVNNLETNEVKSSKQLNLDKLEEEKLFIDNYAKSNNKKYENYLNDIEQILDNKIK